MGWQYRCFVEDCEKICANPQKRRMHLIDKHLFPKNYDFFIVNTGIDRRSSMLRTHRRGSSAASRNLRRDSRTYGTTKIPLLSDERNQGIPLSSHQTQEESSSSSTNQEAPDVDNLTTSMSALRFVPASVRFGRGGRRGGLSSS